MGCGMGGNLTKEISLLSKYGCSAGVKEAKF
jgi:hypothetical protein